MLARSALIGLVISALATLTGCGVKDDGPLVADNNGGESRTCLEERGAHDFTFGSTVLRNTGAELVRLTDVDLVGNEGFTIESAELLTTRDDLVGAASDYPPPWVVSRDDYEWDTRRDAFGAEIGPSSGPVVENLVLHLYRKDATSAATLDALLLTYEVEGDKYEERTAAGLGVGVAC